MKRIASSLILVLAAATALSSSSWEGSAMMGAYGEFPATGLFAACNSFERNTAVEVRNVENDRIVTVIVTKGLSSAGIFMVLSPEAALALGIDAGAVARVAVSEPRSVADIGSPTSRGDTSDPDFNPSVLARKAAAEAAARGAAPAPVAASPAITAPVATAPVATTPVVTAPAETAPVATTPVATAPVVAAPAGTAPVAPAPVATAPAATPASTRPPELIAADPVPATVASKPSAAPLPAPVPAPAKPVAAPVPTPVAEAPRPPEVFHTPKMPSAGSSLARSTLIEPVPPPELPSVFAGLPWPGMAAASLPPASWAEPRPPAPPAAPVLVPEDRAFLLALERARKEGVSVSAELLDARFQITPEELALVMALERPGLESFVASASLYDPPYDLSHGELAFAHELLRAGREEGPAAVFLHDPSAPGAERALAYGIEAPEPLSPEISALLSEPGLAPGEIPGIHDLVAAPALAMAIPELALDEGVIRIEEGEFASLHDFDAPPSAEAWPGDFALHDPELEGKETPSVASGRVLHPFPAFAEASLSEPDLVGPEASPPSFRPSGAAIDAALADPALETPDGEGRLPAPAGSEASVALSDPALEHPEAAARLPAPAEAVAEAVLADPGEKSVATAPAPVPAAPLVVPSATVTTASAPSPAPAGPLAVSVEPTSPRPPSAAPAGTVPVAASTPAPAAAPAAAPATLPGRVTVVAGLEKGAFYIQLGAYTDLPALELAAARVMDLGTVLAERIAGKDGKTAWRLVLGPLGRDESGVALLRAKSLGFRDAFLKKGT